MDEALDDALCDVLERIESGGSVSTQWLQARYPSSWRDLRGALALDRDLAPAAVPVERIAGIRLGDWIGSGAMGVVFEGAPEDAADARRMPSRVAVKLLHADFASVPEFRERLAREIEIGRGVVHANLVRTLAAGVEASAGRERAYLVMEYAEGETLRALLDEHGRLPETLCRRIGREIAEALAALHAAGAVHRDVKAENVILGSDGFVKLMDYGVAFVAEESRRGAPAAFVGTVLYAAPEQFSRAGARIDGRTDLYALGVVLHELATGVHPFAAKDARTSLELRMEGPPPASRHFPDVSPFLEAAIARLLDPDADRRFASAREFADTLAEGETSVWWRRTSAEIDAARSGLRRAVRVSRDASVAGRESEVAALRGLFAQARDGSGVCALLVGEAGVGKSRLVDELAVRLAAGGEDFHFLYGSYSPDAVAAAGGAFSEALRGHFGDAALEDALTPRLGALAPLVTTFAAMLRGSVARDATPLSREAVPTLFLETLRSLARDRTTVLVIDDLHFAPDEGRDLFRDLARAVGGDRVLLVGTSRPEALPARIDALTAPARVHRIDLARLGDADVERIVADALGGGAAPEEIAAEVARRCDGNPLLAFGVLQGLRDDGAVTRELSGAWRFDRSRAGAGVPAGVREIVRARLASLDAADRELVDVAACAGFEFDPSLVGEALGAGPLAVLRRLARLEASTRLVRSYGTLVRFDHHLAQETIYADLGEAPRARHHGSLAAAIERRGAETPHAADDRTVALCRHWLRAGDGAKAGPLVIAAIDVLAGRHEHGAAIALADEALAAGGVLTAEARIDVLVRKADRLNFLGRTDEMDAASQEAVRFADGLDDTVRRIHARRVRGNALIALSRGDEAVLSFESATAICPPASADLVTIVQERLATALVLMSRSADARRAADAALAAAQTIGDRGAESRACLAIATLETDAGSVADALGWAQRSLAIAAGVGLDDVAGRARVLVGRGLLRTSDFARATAAIEECHSSAVASGDRRLAAQADGLSGQQWLTLGDAVRARRHAERALRIGRELCDPRVETLACFHLAGAADFLGESAEALRLGWHALELTKRSSNHRRAMSVLSNLGIGYMSLGAYDEGLARISESRELGRRFDDEGQVEWCDDRLILLDVARGATARAEAVLRRRIDDTCELGDGRHLNLSGELAGLLEQTGRADEARRLVGPLMEVAEGPGFKAHRLHIVLLAAVLGVVSPRSAEACFAELAPKSASWHRLEARHLLWRSTQDPAHLAEAHRLLQHRIRHAPVEYRDSMLVNHPLYRAVHEAWQRHGS